MKVWISKYALSSGIKEAECTEVNERGRVSPFGMYNSYKMGEHAHTTREAAAAAAAAAEQMRIKKLASLKKQIAKLEKMTFAEDAK